MAERGFGGDKPRQCLFLRQRRYLVPPMRRIRGGRDSPCLVSILTWLGSGADPSGQQKQVPVLEGESGKLVYAQRERAISLGQVLERELVAPDRSLWKSCLMFLPFIGPVGLR